MCVNDMETDHHVQPYFLFSMSYIFRFQILICLDHMKPRNMKFRPCWPQQLPSRDCIL